MEAAIEAKLKRYTNVESILHIKLVLNSFRLVSSRFSMVLYNIEYFLQK